MRQKKLCILGTIAVGKTSLFRRFIDNMFSDVYQTSVGVSVSKKVVKIGESPLAMVIWDIYGEDGGTRIHLTPLRGMSGFLLVADGTRPLSVEGALRIYERIYDFEAPPPKPDSIEPYVQFPHRRIPFLFLLNKADLVEEWKIKDSQWASLRNKGWPVYETSAKTGRGVEEAFVTIGHRMLA
jgi:GTPase SAR1 family protein